MFVEERQGIILSLLEENGNVKVKELSEKFKVTEDCIRKDLASMENRGLLQRAYGGAVKNKLNVHNINVSERIDKNIDIKKKIAKKAMKYISEGDTVFLDISTINIELAKLIVKTDINVTVVTNMVEVMQVFTAPCSANVIFLGGTFNRGKDGFIGAITISCIENYRFDKAFMGVVGINVDDNSVETYVAEDGLTKKAAVERSRYKYIVAEAQKYDMSGTYTYASISDFTGIISESAPAKNIINKIKDYIDII